MKKVAGGDICPPTTGSCDGISDCRERDKNMNISTLATLMEKRHCRKRKIKMHSNGNSVWKAIHNAITIAKGINPIICGWLANSQTNPVSVHKN